MYRKIEARMWTDPKFRRLKSNEKLVFLYLITCPGAHVSGVYYLSTAAACDETGLSDADLRYGIDTLSTAGLIRFDQASSTVWVVNMLRYQGRGGKIMKCVANHLADIHSDDIISKYLKHYESFNIPYRRGIDTQPIGKPELAYQEQDQEQEQEKEKPSEPPPSPPSTTTPSIGEILPDAISHTRPGSRQAPPRALMPDNRPGVLQPELEELQHLYATTWGKDPADVPILSHDHLRRAREALSDNRAGIALSERIDAAMAAIRGHRREAMRDGSQLGKGWRSVYPIATDNGRQVKNRLDWERYMEFVQAGRATKARVPTKTEKATDAREARRAAAAATPEGRAKGKARAREIREQLKKKGATT